eukprot:2313920-Heterocapsa_arctica.AAC.1
MSQLRRDFRLRAEAPSYSKQAQGLVTLATLRVEHCLGNSSRGPRNGPTRRRVRQIDVRALFRLHSLRSPPEATLLAMYATLWSRNPTSSGE